jgi:hypothetical protein
MAVALNKRTEAKYLVIMGLFIIIELHHDLKCYWKIPLSV